MKNGRITIAAAQAFQTMAQEIKQRVASQPQAQIVIKQIKHILLLLILLIIIVIMITVLLIIMLIILVY